MRQQAPAFEQHPTATVSASVAAGYRRPTLVRPTKMPSANEADLERELLAFDPEEDVAAAIPMPPTIPADVRSAITDALLERFADPEALDAWLHTPQATLDGESPFARIVDGHGHAVLFALVGSAMWPGDRGPVEDPMAAAQPRLRVLR